MIGLSHLSDALNKFSVYKIRTKGKFVFLSILHEQFVFQLCYFCCLDIGIDVFLLSMSFNQSIKCHRSISPE